MKFESEMMVYDFYNEYSKRNGFGIRREYANKSRIYGVLTSRRFICFKEGIQGVDKRQHSGEPRAETRTSYQTRMVISLDQKIVKYKFVDYIAQRNHPLQPLEYVYMIRSNRRIYESQTYQMVLVDESVLKPKDVHEYMSKQVGGIKNIGFTRRDLKNYL